jgi:hypothetical protein
MTCQNAHPRPRDRREAPQPFSCIGAIDECERNELAGGEVMSNSEWDKIPDDIKPWVLAGIVIVLSALIAIAMVSWIFDRHPNSPHNRKRAQEIRDDPRWGGAFRVVEIKQAVTARTALRLGKDAMKGGLCHAMARTI